MAYVEATITSARDLPAMKKVKNSSDAYVVASIDYTAGGANDEISYNALLIPSGKTYKTQTAWDTRHPRSVFGVSRGRRVVLCETEKVCACVCTCRPGKEGVSGDLFLLTYMSHNQMESVLHDEACAINLWNHPLFVEGQHGYWYRTGCINRMGRCEAGGLSCTTSAHE